MLHILERLNRLTADMVPTDIETQLKHWYRQNNTQFPFVSGEDHFARATIQYITNSDQLLELNFAKSVDRYTTQEFQENYIQPVKNFTRIIAGKEAGAPYSLHHIIRTTYSSVGRELQSAFPGMIVTCKEPGDRITAVTLVRFESEYPFRQATFWTMRTKTEEDSDFFKLCIESGFTNVYAIQSMHSFVSERIFDSDKPVVVNSLVTHEDVLNVSEMERMLSVYMPRYGYRIRSVDNMPSEHWEAMDNSHSKHVGAGEIPTLFFEAQKTGNPSMYFAIKESSIVRIYLTN